MDKIKDVIQESLGKTGLIISMGNLRLTGWNSIAGSNIVLKDRRDGSIPLTISKFEIRFDVMALLKNGKHPESALQEIMITQPRVLVRRYRDQTWNFTRYFQGDKRPLILRPKLRFDRASFVIEDYQYGRHLLNEISGNINMNAYPSVAWDLKGNADFNPNLTWTSQGNLRADKPLGTGIIGLRHVDLVKAVTLLPSAMPCRIDSGTADLKLSLLWNRTGFKFGNGSGDVPRAEVMLPDGRRISVAGLKATFSPERLWVDSARLFYGGSVVKAAGSYDFKSKAVSGVLNSDQLNLSDIKSLLPQMATGPFTLTGMASLRLDLSGRITAPVLNGEIYLSDTNLTLDGAEKFSQISGRLLIKQSDLEIKRLEGNWRDSLIGISGRVINLFNPTLELRLNVDGNGAKLNDILAKYVNGLKVDGNVSLTGSVQGNWRNLKGNGEINVAQLDFEGQSARNVKADFGIDLVSNRLEIRKVDGELWEGAFTGNGELRLSADEVRWKLNGVFTDVDLERIPVDSEYISSGRASADVVAGGVWRKDDPLGQLEVLGSFSGKSLVIRGTEIKEAKGLCNYRDGVFRLETVQAGLTEGGRIFGSLSWDGSNLTADLDVRKTPIGRLIPLSKSYPVNGVFSGSVELDGPIGNISARVNGELSHAVWDDITIGTVNGEVIYRDNKIQCRGIRATTEFGDFEIQGAIDLAGPSALQLAIRSNNMQLKGLVNLLPVDPSLKLDGTGVVQVELTGTMATPIYKGFVNIENPSIANIRVDRGEMGFEGDLNELRITRFDLFRGDSRVTIAGTVNRESWDLHLDGKAVQLDLLNLGYNGKKLAGVVDFNAELTGSPAKPLFAASMSGNGIRFGTWSYDRLQARLSWDGHGVVVDEAKLIRDAGSIDLTGRIIPAKPFVLDLNLSVNSCELTDLLQFVNMPKEVTASGIVSGQVKISGPWDNPTIRCSGNLGKGIVNEQQVTGLFDLSYEQNKIVIQKVELLHNGGTLSARGVWEDLQTLKIQAKLTNFPMETLNPFLDKTTQVKGLVNSDLYFEFSSSKVFGAYQVDMKDLSFNGASLGDIYSVGEFNDQGLTVETGKLSVKNGFLTASGYVPWPTVWLDKLKLPTLSQTSKSIAMTIQVKNIPAQTFNGFQNLVNVSQGVIDGDLAISGSLPLPNVNGELRCDAVACQVADLPSPINGLQAILTIRDNQVQFQKAQGNFGSGKFDVTGQATLAGPGELQYSLGLQGSQLYYQNPFFDGYGDVNVALNGNVNARLSHTALSGEIRIYNCKTGILGSVPALKKDGWNPELDLTINTGDNVRFRQPGLADAIITGKLQVKGDLQNPLLNGEINTRNGMLTFYNRTFKIDRGRAVFNNNVGFTPVIDVTSSIFLSQTSDSPMPVASRIEVFLDIKGQVGSNLNITVHSQPYKSQSEIYALLNWPDLYALSNQSSASSDPPLTVSGVVAGNLSFITDSVFGDLFYELRRTLNVDYLYLEQNYQKNDFRLNIGNQITDRLFLSYSRSFSEVPNDDLDFDYSLNSFWNIGGTYNFLDKGTIWRLLFQINL